MTPAARRRAADRQKAYRQRRRNGERVFRVKAGRKVIEALLLRGMTEANSRRRRPVEQELAVVLEQWAEHWLK